ncbi:MAG: chaperone modulator CbpM [Chitinophagales bacterium]|nr:chaperone modulator CbpM [Chitinophagales bacterium]
MDNQEIIYIKTICTEYNVDPLFLDELNEIGLIKTVLVNNEISINSEQLSRVEKMIRMHHEMDINTAGIDAVFNLLDQIDSLTTELNSLKNRLSLYE